jgi:hypothetical protein
MRGADVQRVFEAILPDKVLMKLVQSAKLQERTRKLDALRLPERVNDFETVGFVV